MKSAWNKKNGPQRLFCSNKQTNMQVYVAGQSGGRWGALLNTSTGEVGAQAFLWEQSLIGERSEGHMARLFGEGTPSPVGGDSRS